MLTQMGHKVVAVSDGAEALEYHRAFGARWDLVIIDMIMPGMDGRQCLRALRGSTRRPGDPVRGRRGRGRHPRHPGGGGRHLHPETLSPGAAGRRRPPGPGQPAGQTMTKAQAPMTKETTMPSAGRAPLQEVEDHSVEKWHADDALDCSYCHQAFCVTDRNRGARNTSRIRREGDRATPSQQTQADRIAQGCRTVCRGIDTKGYSNGFSLCSPPEHKECRKGDEYVSVNPDGQKHIGQRHPQPPLNQSPSRS